jgi:PAS domain S-box-containing protein
MDREIKILLVEDVVTDIELISRAIKKSKIQFSSKIVETREDFLREVQEFSPDIILSDYALPVFTGSEALMLRNKLTPHLPFILVTGSNNEETAVECMKAGADDYIIKDNLMRLGTAIQAALDKYEFYKSKKEAEDALSESEALFRTAFESAAIAVCMVDEVGKFINVNSTLCQMLGYSRTELLNFTFNDITHPEDKNISHILLLNANSGNANKINFEKRYIHKNGQTVWVNLFTTKVYSHKNNSYYFISYIHNITERKKSEQELIKAKERAEESDRLKTAFLQNISHEIRTPMNAIIGFSGFLKDPQITPEKTNLYTDIIVNSSNQLLSIITDIISISRIEAGQEKVFVSEINLNSLLNQLYIRYLPDAKGKGIMLKCFASLNDQDARIRTDESKLEAILSNLINNALKFTSDGSVEFGYKFHGNELKFYVKDTGIGIDPSMHEEIFKRFRQVEITESRRFGGSGLGLSISKGYVELIGGKIWLNSVPEFGSVFHFTIPYNKIGETKEPERKFHFIKSGKPITILIAEDERSNYELLARVLTKENIKIVRAENGKEVLEFCQSGKHIDLILMDIKMPEMDGIEATRRIKEIYPDIPIIAQTAYSFPDEKNKAIMAGCDLFLSKPINKEALFQAIRKLTAIK